MVQHQMEGRDDIETNNMMSSQHSSFDARQDTMRIEGNRKKKAQRGGWYWYLYGLLAMFIFVGSFHAAHTFFKIQLAQRSHSMTQYDGIDREKCQNDDPRCYKLSLEELADLERQTRDGAHPSDADTVGIVR